VGFTSQQGQACGFQHFGRTATTAHADKREGPTQRSEQQPFGGRRTEAKRSGIAVSEVGDFVRDVRNGMTDLSSRAAGVVAHESASLGTVDGIEEKHQSSTGTNGPEGR
jgi:hypothetical protein